MSSGKRDNEGHSNKKLFREIKYPPIKLQFKRDELLPMQNSAKKAKEFKYRPLKMDLDKLCEGCDLNSGHKKDSGRKAKKEIKYPPLRINFDKELAAINKATAKTKSTLTVQSEISKKKLKVEEKKKGVLKPRETPNIKPRKSSLSVVKAKKRLFENMKESPKLLKISNDDPHLDHNTSSNEFLIMEKACGINEYSPITNLTNGLKSVKITENSTFEKIEKLRAEMRTNFDNYKAACAKYERQFQTSMTQIDTLQGELFESNKENRKRKSFKSPDGNLLKGTLKKNLIASAKKQKIDKSMEKALKYYNKFRSEDPFLETPKVERNKLQTPTNKSDMSLGMKLQKQCLLLVDTPTK